MFLFLDRNSDTEQDVKTGVLGIGSIPVTKFEIVSRETSADLAILVSKDIISSLKVFSPKYNGERKLIP